MELGARIFRLRTQKHLSQDELAGALGVSRQSVSKWENDASVPELDNLVQMSELFGVSLDELVKGAPAPAPAEPPGPAGPPVPAEPPASAGPGRCLVKIAGVILLCLGGLAVFFLLGLGGGVFSLLLALPFVGCGAVCLTARRRAGLWCAWTVWLCVELYLRWATGLSWQTILMTPVWTPEMNYTRLAIGWVMAVIPLLLMALSVRSFGGAGRPRRAKPLACLGAWAAALGAWLLRTGLYSWFFAQYRMDHTSINPRLEAALFWTRTLGDWSLAALLCTALVFTLALWRQRRQPGA